MPLRAPQIALLLASASLFAALRRDVTFGTDSAVAPDADADAAMSTAAKGETLRQRHAAPMGESPAAEASFATEEDHFDDFQDDILNDGYVADEVGGLQGGDGHRLRYLICTSWGYRGEFAKQQQLLQQAFPRLAIEVESYPVSTWKTTISTLITIVQFGLVALAFAGDRIFGYLGTPMPPQLRQLLSSKLYLFGGFFILGQIASSFKSSGAYEVYLDDQLLHSKLQTGQLPSVDFITNALISSGLNPAGSSNVESSEFVRTVPGARGGGEFSM